MLCAVTRIFLLIAAIFLGSFKISYDELTEAILKIDDQILTQSALEMLLKFLPSNDQVRETFLDVDDYYCNL